MFYKVYSRLPPEFPLTPLDVRQSLNSIFERSAVMRGWVEVSPQETLIIIALSWGYGKHDIYIPPLVSRLRDIS